MTGDRAEIERVKDGLKDRIEDVCRWLLPDGRREGRLWVSSNPVTGDVDQEPALKVALTRDVGAWIDWRSGDKGDVVGLISYLKATDFIGAMDEARRFLGIGRMTARERADFSADHARRKQEREAAAARTHLKRLRRAEEMFAGGGTLDGGGPAVDHGLAYYAWRGVPLDAIDHLDRTTFRFLPELEWWEGAVWKMEGRRWIKVKPGPSFPAIVCAFRSPIGGQLTAVHCTFLDRLKPVKAPVKKPKLIFCPFLGSVIRISHGPGGALDPNPTEARPLLLCEGVEDGLSLALGVPERVWAAGSLAGIGAAPIGWCGISSVYVARDNDWTNPQAVAQFERAMAALETHGKPIAEMSSPVGKDFNDGYQED